MNYVTQERFDRLRSGKIEANDILYCLRGSLGKAAVVRGIMQGAIASSLIIVRPLASTSSDYVLHYFGSNLAADMVGRYDNGTAQPILGAASLSKFLLPLPPLAEQRRIVAKVDELMRLCDELESRQEKRRSVRVSLNTSALDALQKADREALPGRWQFVRDHFDLLYQDPQNVQKLKETILQLAVQGKLWGKQWDRVPLADLVAVVGGNTPSKQNASFWGGDIPWLSPKD